MAAGDVTLTLTIPQAKVADGIAAITSYLIDRGDLPPDTVLTGAEAKAALETLCRNRIKEIYRVYYEKIEQAAASAAASSKTNAVILS